MKKLALLLCLGLLGGAVRSAAEQKEPMKIKMTFNGREAVLLMQDNAAVAQLAALLPAEFTISGVRVEEGTCYLSLPGRSIEVLPADPAEQRLMLQSIAWSLYSLDAVEELRILVDGQEVETFGQVPTEEFLFRPAELSAD